MRRPNNCHNGVLASHGHILEHGTSMIGGHITQSLIVNLTGSTAVALGRRVSRTQLSSGNSLLSRCSLLFFAVLARCYFVQLASQSEDFRGESRRLRCFFRGITAKNSGEAVCHLVHRYNLLSMRSSWPGSSPGRSAHGLDPRASTPLPRTKALGRGSVDGRIKSAHDELGVSCTIRMALATSGR